MWTRLGNHLVKNTGCFTLVWYMGTSRKRPKPCDLSVGRAMGGSPSSSDPISERFFSIKNAINSSAFWFSVVPNPLCTVCYCLTVSVPLSFHHTFSTLSVSGVLYSA